MLTLIGKHFQFRRFLSLWATYLQVDIGQDDLGGGGGVCVCVCVCVCEGQKGRLGDPPHCRAHCCPLQVMSGHVHSRRLGISSGLTSFPLSFCWMQALRFGPVLIWSIDSGVHYSPLLWGSLALSQ